MFVRVTLDLSVISPLEQEYGWYFFNPNMDGVVTFRQRGGGAGDTFGVPWHVSPLAASRTKVRPKSLDLSGGQATLSLTNDGAGVNHADSYLLGAEDELGSRTEEDITHIGARSFTGEEIDGVPEGVPGGADPLAGISWIDFLTFADAPEEPVAFGVRTSGVHNTTETFEVDVLIDAGADGVFADPVIGADFLAAKLPAGVTCLFDLSLDDPFADCAELYFPDYSSFNTNVTGAVVDAGAIGLSNAHSKVAYAVEACTLFNEEFGACDTAGGLDEETGTYSSVLDTTQPELNASPLVCGGFWGDPACDSVAVSAGPGAQESSALLMLFPNNHPRRTAMVVPATGTGNL